MCVCVFVCTQERIIERLKDQREREDRERLEEVDSYKKENKDLKEKVNSLQIELTEKEVSEVHEEVSGSESSSATSLRCRGACRNRSLAGAVQIACVVRPSAVQSHRPEGARLVAGLVRPEEGFQAQVAGDRHRAEERGV